jgi:methylated-DNA-[protein]-cysteine S-methyltransferase
MTQCWTTLQSPVGDVLIASDGDAVTAISFASEPPAQSERADEHPVLADARAQLTAYFARERTDFDLPIRLRGTPFQLRVWEALRDIPYGTTTGYGAIAGRLGMSRGSARAVGLANATNPVAIVVPCHRVIGSNGKLVGYAGGLDRKRTLLALERDGLF